MKQESSKTQDAGPEMKLFMGFEPGRLVMNNQLLVMKAKFYSGRPDTDEFRESFPVPVVFENKQTSRAGDLCLTQSSAEQIMQITRQLKAASEERLASFFVNEVPNVPQVILEVGNTDLKRLPIGYLLDSSQDSSQKRMVVAFDPMEGAYSFRPTKNDGVLSPAEEQKVLRRELESSCQYCYSLAQRLDRVMSLSDGSGSKALADRLFEDTVYVYLEHATLNSPNPLMAFGQNRARSDITESESDRFDPRTGHYTVPNGSYDFEFSLSSETLIQAVCPFISEQEKSSVEFYYENDEGSAYEKVSLTGDRAYDQEALSKGLSALRNQAEESLIQHYDNAVSSELESRASQSDVYRDAQDLYEVGPR